MDELINFDGLGEVIVNLTNKLADGIGWIANRETPKKLAINTYIKDIQEKERTEGGLNTRASSCAPLFSTFLFWGFYTFKTIFQKPLHLLS